MEKYKGSSHFIPTVRLDCLFLCSFSGFTWNVEEDFKMVPETWIPAHGVIHHNGHPVPDEHGHIPGPEVQPLIMNLMNHKIISDSRAGRVTSQSFAANVITQSSLV